MVDVLDWIFEVLLAVCNSCKLWGYKKSRIFCLDDWSMSVTGNLWAKTGVLQLVSYSKSLGYSLQRAISFAGTSYILRPIFSIIFFKVLNLVGVFSHSDYHLRSMQWRKLVFKSSGSVTSNIVLAST